MTRLDKKITVNGVEYCRHHTSWHRGYISRKEGQAIRRYEGRFGHGYVLLEASWKSTRYHYITYYVKEA